MTDLSKIALILREAIPHEIAIGASIAPINESILSSGERQYLESVTSESRKASFTLGRAAAKIALEGLNTPRLAEAGVLRDSDGAPVWPQTVVGSISNKNSYAIAIAASAEKFQTVGIDLEKKIPNLKILKKISLPSEQSWVEERESELRITQLFTAKEALFKAIYPLKRIFFGFKDAELFPTPGGFQCVGLTRFPDVKIANINIVSVHDHNSVCSVVWIPR